MAAVQFPLLWNCLPELVEGGFGGEVYQSDNAFNACPAMEIKKLILIQINNVV